MIVQPAMLHGMETLSMTSPHVKKLEVTELKMCRWACGHTLSDQARNGNIRERLKVEDITERCWIARLVWFGHVKRRRNILEVVPHGIRKRGRPKQKWMDCVNWDMRAIGTTRYEVHDRTGWRSCDTRMEGPTFGIQIYVPTPIRNPDHYPTPWPGSHIVSSPTSKQAYVCIYPGHFNPVMFTRQMIGLWSRSGQGVAMMNYCWQAGCVQDNPLQLEQFWPRGKYYLRGEKISNV